MLAACLSCALSWEGQPILYEQLVQGVGHDPALMGSIVRLMLAWPKSLWSPTGDGIVQLGKHEKNQAQHSWQELATKARVEAWARETLRHGQCSG